MVEPTADGHRILPSHPSIRLWEDSEAALIAPGVRTAPALSFTAKSRFLAGDEIRFATNPALAPCYFLGNGEVATLEFQRLSAAEAPVEWVKHSFLLDVEESPGSPPISTRWPNWRTSRFITASITRDGSRIWHGSGRPLWSTPDPRGKDEGFCLGDRHDESGYSNRFRCRNLSCLGRAARGKHELIAGEVFAMAGARREHVVVSGNLAVAFKQRLRGGPCQAYVASLKLRVEAVDAFSTRMWWYRAIRAITRLANSSPIRP